jgi:predicted nucleic-acid-binding protein
LRSLDTSVLARFLLGDDTNQFEMAARLVRDPFWVPLTVWLELGWVLFKALNLPRETVADMLQQIVSLETGQFENAPGIEWALSRFRDGADWADMIHLAASEGQAAGFATFDRKLARDAGGSPPIPVETLRA